MPYTPVFIAPISIALPDGGHSLYFREWDSDIIHHFFHVAGSGFFYLICIRLVSINLCNLRNLWMNVITSN